MLSEREARLRTRTLGWGSLVVLLACAAIYGATSTFYVALLIPWIAALVYRQGYGAIHLLVGKGDPRPNVSHVYMFSVLWPGVWELAGTSFLRWDLLIALALIIGFPLALVAVRNPRSNRADLAFLLILNSFYGLGVAAAINHDLDSGTPEIRAAQVMDKRMRKARGRDHYTLRLRSWRFPGNKWNLEVHKQDYTRASVRGNVCIEIHPGALGIPWFHTKAWAGRSVICASSATGPTGQEGHKSPLSGSK